MTRILVVEDDDSVRALVTRALQSAGYEVEQAADGAQGLEMIEAVDAGYDLVVSDIRMPEMDGIEMSKEAARRFPGIRIVLMTGYADQRERAEELDNIIVDVILKPFTLTDFRTVVAKALGRGPSL